MKHYRLCIQMTKMVNFLLHPSHQRAACSPSATGTGLTFWCPRDWDIISYLPTLWSLFLPFQVFLNLQLPHRKDFLKVLWSQHLSNKIWTLGIQNAFQEYTKIYLFCNSQTKMTLLGKNLLWVPHVGGSPVPTRFCLTGGTAVHLAPTVIIKKMAFVKMSNICCHAGSPPSKRWTNYCSWLRTRERMKGRTKAFSFLNSTSTFNNTSHTGQQLLMQNTVCFLLFWNLI